MHYQSSEFPFATSIISFAENQGVSIARNACVAKARSGLLYFSDDDVLLRPETLLEHLSFQQKYTQCVAVGGVDWHDQGKIEKMNPRHIKYWNLHGMNTSLPKAGFEAVGGFPEWLRGYGHEDVLLGYLLSQHGYDFVALQDAVVDHIGANPMLGLQPDKARQAGKNAVKIIRKYPQLAFRLGVHPLLIKLKQLALYSPLGYVWKMLSKGSYSYERAYLEGVLEEKQHV